jgi:hypothetical protein
MHLKNLSGIFLLLAGLAGFAQTNSNPPVYYPNALAIDSKGSLYVSCHSQMPDIVKITPDGKGIELVSVTLNLHKAGGRWPSIHDFIPEGLAMDEGDNLFIADRGGADILKVTPDGGVTIFAGNKGHKVVDGPLSIAAFKNLHFISIDRQNNIYVTDEGGDESNNTAYGIIRKITPDGNVSTLKDKNGTEFHFDAAGMDCDTDGDLFVCDRIDRCLKKITPDGTVSIVGGLCGKRKTNPVFKEGDIQSAEFMEPWYICLGANGAIFFSDIRLNRILSIEKNKLSAVAGNSKIDTEGANIQGYSEAGYQDGPAKKALFNEPLGLVFDNAGNLLIADGINHCIRRLSPDGIVSTFYK